MTSIDGQTCKAWEQVFLRDTAGKGVADANRELAENDYKINGKYVLVLDDDDMLTDETAIARLTRCVEADPAVIMFRGDYDHLGILPSADVWEKKPLMGHIGSMNFVTRRDVWARHISAFNADVCGDYWFLRSIWEERPDVIWLDRVLVGVQRISGGEPE